MKPLNKAFFWDVKKVNFKENESFVIDRILNFGDVQDFKWAIEFYGEKKIRESIKNSRALDAKPFNFWTNYFNINKSQCIRNLSTKKQSAFWKR